MERMHACKILNIDVNFTPEELKQAFRENALRYHPDKTKSCLLYTSPSPRD